MGVKGAFAPQIGGGCGSFCMLSIIACSLYSNGAFYPATSRVRLSCPLPFQRSFAPAPCVLLLLEYSYSLSIPALHKDKKASNRGKKGQK